MFEQSPSSRASPAKQNVNFKQEPILKKFQPENEISSPEQPYEVINVRISQNTEESSKVKTPPMQTKLYDNKNMRVVPIVRDVRKMKDKSENPLTSGTVFEQSKSMREVPIQIRRDKATNMNPFLSETNESVIKKSPSPNRTEVHNNSTQAKGAFNL